MINGIRDMLHMRADKFDLGSHWLFLITVLANSCTGIHTMQFITEKVKHAWQTLAPRCSFTDWENRFAEPFSLAEHGNGPPRECTMSRCQPVRWESQSPKISRWQRNQGLKSCSVNNASVIIRYFSCYLHPSIHPSTIHPIMPLSIHPSLFTSSWKCPDCTPCKFKIIKIHPKLFPNSQCIVTSNKFWFFENYSYWHLRNKTAHLKG